jgi:hypothetical protein
MASPEPMRTAAERSVPFHSDEIVEIPFAPEERDDLIREVAAVFNEAAGANSILDRIGFPPGGRPTWTGITPDQWWAQIARQLGYGIVAAPNRRLLEAALRVYAHNQVFRGLALRYGLILPNGSGPTPVPEAREIRLEPEPVVVEPEPEPVPVPVPVPVSETPSAPPVVENEARPMPAAGEASATCHVIVRASSEDARAEAGTVLRVLGLDPQDVWATAHAVSYRVSLADVREVRRLLDTTQLGWTVVPPGVSDYLLRELYVQGPDGRRFRLLDAPAQQTVGNVAAEIVDQYGPAFADRARPTVVDHVESDGKGRRLDPDHTLDQAGVRERSFLRVGFQATAGAVNPLDRQDALSRVRNELLAMAGTRPDLVVRGAPPTLPTEYELEFTQRSLRASPQDGGEPVEIDRHVVLIRLPPDFPEKPPIVYWLTPVFHPNIFPSYPCDLSREYPMRRGLVCLGVLAEEYLPGMDFGDLVHTLIAIAAYRNYALFEPTGDVRPDGLPEVRGNYYDPIAARWAVANQDRIAAMGGALIWGQQRRSPEYHNVIEIAG